MSFSTSFSVGSSFSLCALWKKGSRSRKMLSPLLVVHCSVSCYIFLMTVTQTVEIPASHRLTIDVPSEVPAGAVILTFTPKTDAADDWFSRGGECPICAAHRDPVTGEERFNAKTLAAFAEGDAILRGEIPAKRFTSVEELLVELDSEY
jgi:hypothetical protein